MTCFLVDDQLMLNAKIQAAIEQFGGPGVIALWLTVGTACGAANTEGVIAPAAPPSHGRMLIMQPPEMEAAVAALVETRLWHDEKTVKRCEACKEHLKGHDIAKLPKGGYLFHDWNQQQFSRKEAKDPSARSGRNRKRALHRMPDLIRAIRARDGSHCRYCGVRVNFDARTGDDAGTYDHKDPDCYEPKGGNFLDAIVVACNACNREKSDRTPEEWVADGGLALQPEPDRRAGVPDPPVRTGSGPDQAEGQDAPGSGQTLTAAPTRVGPGQDGSGPGPGLRSEDGSSRVPVLTPSTNGNDHRSNGDST